MNPYTNQPYSEEELKDISERLEKAATALTELNLVPQCIVSKVKMSAGDGSEIFVDRVQPYLQDTKYKPEIKVEIQDEAPQENTEPVETK